MKFTHQPGATPVDGFTIRRGIHRGGFGEVYYAVSDAGKEVALKLLQHEQDVELRGVTQCLNLKHPNLVNLFDVKTDSHGESWVVMEYVNGTSLEDVLAAFPNGLPLEEVRDWLTGLVAGVSHLHDRGIVHRDLKPANVYRENGTVKVGDVGLSKKLGSDRRGAHTQSVGTVYYMAPEVAKGQYGPEVDVYSLGIMLYELLTGRVPFTGETTAEVLMKHLTTKPDLARLPERLRPVVAHALEKSPHLRTGSAKQLEDEFLCALDARGMGTAEPSRSPPPIPANPAPSPSPAREVRVNTPNNNARSVRASSTSVSDLHRWVVMTGVVVGGLIVFSPGTPRAWVGLGLAAAAYAVALFARPPKWGPDEVEPIAEPITPLRQVLAEPVSSTRSRTRAVSQLPLGSLLSREALHESSFSLTLASLCACLLSVGMYFAKEFTGGKPTSADPPELFIVFMSTVMAGAWTLILANQCTRRTSWGDRHPRLVNLIAGVLVGTMAFGLDEFLKVDYLRSGMPRSAFQSLGVHALTTTGSNPTWLGYAVFFGLLFAVKRWWVEMDVQRPKRFSLGRLFSACGTAFLVTVFFEFPATPAMLWAVTLSATVQLATPWSPTRSRESFWRTGP